MKTNNNNTISVLENLEILNIRVERLQGLAKVCASAFEHPEVFSSIKVEDLENTFYSFADNAGELNAEIMEVIAAICENRAIMKYIDREQEK